MTREQMRAQLEEADRNLSDAVAQLLAGPAHNPGFVQSLQASAKFLDQANRTATVRERSGSPFSVAQLRNLQANAARAQRLLDSAALFYGCAIIPAGSDQEIYTADGLLHSKTETGCLELEG